MPSFVIISITIIVTIFKSIIASIVVDGAATNVYVAVFSKFIKSCSWYSTFCWNPFFLKPRDVWC